jgi:hypothetical protein
MQAIQKYDDALISRLITMGYLENIFTPNKLILSLDKIKPLNYLSRVYRPSKPVFTKFLENNKSFLEKVLQFTIKLSEKLSLMDDEFVCVDAVKIKSNTNSFKNIFLTDITAFKYANDFELFSKENKKKDIR